MKIQIACPECSNILQDIFSAEECIIMFGNSYYLRMECLKCEKEYEIDITTKEWIVKP